WIACARDSGREYREQAPGRDRATATEVLAFAFGYHRGRRQAPDPRPVADRLGCAKGRAPRTWRGVERASCDYHRERRRREDEETMAKQPKRPEAIPVDPQDLQPNHRWHRPLQAPGISQVDFEERV